MWTIHVYINANCWKYNITFILHCSETEQDSEQADLIEDVPAHGRGVGLDDL